MLSSTRLCKAACNVVPRCQRAAVTRRTPIMPKQARKPLTAVYGTRMFHTSTLVAKRDQDLTLVKPPEPHILLDGEIVPQSRLNDILAHLGEEEEVPMMQEIIMELEPFVVNEVIDVGRHTKILPGTYSNLGR